MPNKRQFRTDAKRGHYRIKNPDTGILVFECHFFALFANCVILKMTSPSEKANCVVGTAFCPGHKKFLETGSVLDKPRSGRPSTSDSDVERIREAFTRSPTKSTRQASIESMLTSTWNEIEYRLDVTRATEGAHIEIW
ncbi:hypothetical protein AVEN_149654-1 [Araneus ventricosus]|uniref:Uncharacterized protein n=2 Tax=Araneus ventricosus TaxID=182803 RepID=A0A4Y2LBQ8_ARAVE|nr:hypothetical protein AVEN_234706-1 [Araneus ventricosus]GBN12003.1 hypothetical protein AVEN_149654-1 [Araneus ventricosus]